MAVDFSSLYQQFYPAGPNRLYVAATGNDSNPGTQASPKRQISAAIAAMPASGGIIYVGNGTYNGFEYRRKNFSANGWCHVMAQNYLGAKVTGHVQFIGSSFCGIYGLEIDQDQGGGTVGGNCVSIKMHTHNAAVWRCRAHHGAVGIGAMGNQDPAWEGESGIDRACNNVYVCYNIVHDCAKPTTDPWGSSGISFYNPWDKSGMLDSTGDDQYGYSNYFVGNIVYWNYQNNQGVDGNGIIIDDGNNTQSYGGPTGMIYYGRTLLMGNLVIKNGGRGIQCFNNRNCDVFFNTAAYNSWRKTDDPNYMGEIGFNAAWGSRCWHNVAWYDTITGNSNWLSYYNTVGIENEMIGNVRLRGGTLLDYDRPAYPNGFPINPNDIDRTADGLNYFKTNNPPLPAENTLINAATLDAWRPDGGSGQVEKAVLSQDMYDKLSRWPDFFGDYRPARTAGWAAGFSESVGGSTPPGQVPVASFTVSPASGSVGTTFQFNDTSTQTPTSWAWNFGDGTTSTQKNPTKVYAAAGTYTITLTATNATGSSTPVTRQVTVTAPVIALTGKRLPGQAGHGYYSEDKGTTAAGHSIRRIKYNMPHVLSGKLVDATALAYIPSGAAPPEGRAVIVGGHGATGVDDASAPSLGSATAAPANAVGNVDNLLNAGYVVVLPDFEGLGVDQPWAEYPTAITALDPANEVDITTMGVSASTPNADQQTAIQNAINNVAVGKTLVFPNGTYRHSGTLIINRNVKLKAANKHQAILIGTTPTNMSVQLTGDGAGLEGLRIEGVGTNRLAEWQHTGVLLRDSDGNFVRDCYVYKSSSAGIHIEGATNFVISGCTVDSTLSDSIHCTGGARWGLIEGCTVLNSGDDMFAVVTYGGQTLCQNITYRNNTGNTGGARGMSVVGGYDILFENNTVTNTRAAGAYVASEPSYNTEASRRVKILNCTLNACNYDAAINHGGIFLWGGRPAYPYEDVWIEGNKINNTVVGGAHIVLQGTDGQRVSILNNVTTGSKPFSYIELASSQYRRIGNVHNGAAVSTAGSYNPTVTEEADHPYMVGTSHGRSMIDAARAMSDFTTTKAHVAFWGFSQGGHAALWAAELAASYAPEFTKAVAVGIDPVISKEWTSDVYNGWAYYYALLIVYGLKQKTPALDYNDILTPGAVAKMASLPGWSIAQIQSQFSGSDFIRNPTTVTAGGSYPMPQAGLNGPGHFSGRILRDGQPLANCLVKVVDAFHPNWNWDPGGSINDVLNGPGASPGYEQYVKFTTTDAQGFWSVSGLDQSREYMLKVFPAGSDKLCIALAEIDAKYITAESGYIEGPPNYGNFMSTRAVPAGNTYSLWYDGRYLFDMPVHIQPTVAGSLKGWLGYSDLNINFYTRTDSFNTTGGPVSGCVAVPPTGNSNWSAAFDDSNPGRQAAKPTLVFSASGGLGPQYGETWRARATAAGTSAEHRQRSGSHDAAFVQSVQAEALAWVNSQLTSTVGVPIAAFTVTPTSAEVGANFTLTNTSTGGSTNNWNFGDGTSSTQANPTKAYAQAGTYTITLTVTNSAGSSTAQRTVSVSAAPPTGTGQYQAELARRGVNAGAPAEVTAPPIWDTAQNFTGTGYVGTFGDPGQYVSWEAGYNPVNVATAGKHRLSFRYQRGEAGGSAIRDLVIDGTVVARLTFPSTSSDWGVGNWQLITYEHTWATTGAKSVKLEIPLDQAMYANYIDVDRLDVSYVDGPTPTPPQANFTASKTTATVGETLSFQSTSTGGPTMYVWDFGDGTTVQGATMANTTHAFGAPGQYAVKLTVSNDNGSTNKTITVTVNAAEPPPEPPPGTENPLAVYKFIVGPGASLDYLVTNALRRSVMFDRREGATATVVMRGEDDWVGAIRELVDDLKITRNDELIFRGRIGPSIDEGDGDKQSVTFSALSYTKKLGSRLLKDTDELDFINLDQGQIAWAFIDAVQQRPNGDEGIRKGVIATGTPKDYSIEPGTDVETAIDQLGSATDGFDWEVDQYLKLNLWSPKRGQVREVVLDYGGAFSAYRRTFNFDSYANAVWATASGGVEPTWVESNDISSRPEGRWERSVAWPDVAKQEAEQDNALWLLEEAKIRKHAYEVTLVPGFWRGPAHFWLGDTVDFRLIHGRLNIKDTRTVESLTIDLDDNGTETVKVALS